MDDAHREFVLNGRRLYYGWPLVGVGFLVYGLGIAPAYYSWGFFGPELVRDLGLTRAQVGSMFGAFTLMLSVVSPLAAAAMGRFGLRAVVTAGALISAFGFWMVGRTESAADLYWSFALVGGLGIGLSTVLPAQTIPVFWFRRYRARTTTTALLTSLSWTNRPTTWIFHQSKHWRMPWQAARVRFC